MKDQLALLAITLIVASEAAHAQFETVASESFDYTSPGVLINQNGGSGFASSWDVQAGGNEVILFDQTVQPAFVGRDAEGAYIGQANGFGRAIRAVDPGPHPNVANGAGFGLDGGTIWFSFRTVAYQVFGAHFGGMFLRDINGEDRLFIGSPWGTFGWGVDDLSPNGAGVTTVISNSAVDAFIVARIDHAAGSERVRLWVDPLVEFPDSTPDIDVMVPDFTWSDIVFSSGGSGSAYYWDDLTISKGDGALGTPFCPGTPNSTGSPGTTAIRGTGTLAANDIVLEANGLPPGTFGIFVNSNLQAPPTAVASGSLCLGGGIGRYQLPGEIVQADASGQFRLPIDLTIIPRPATVVSAMPGETWYFQAWHRDFTTTPPIMTTSNFAGGASFTVR